MLSALALLVLFAVIRATPRWWWAWVAGGAAALVFVLSFAYPVLFEPIFNKFTPMADTPAARPSWWRWPSGTGCR